MFEIHNNKIAFKVIFFSSQLTTVLKSILVVRMTTIVTMLSKIAKAAVMIDPTFKL